MAKGNKYEWTFAGRKREWSFAIQKEGFTATATRMLAGENAFLTWGSPTNELGATLLPCDLKLEIIDPDLTLYNELISAAEEEDSFRLRATDSTGTYTLNMRVRLDTVETYLVPGLQEQITSLYGYCGLAETKNIDAITLSSASIHRIFRDILSMQLISQDIEYLAGIYPTNIHTSGAVLDLVRLNRLDLIYAEEGRKIDNMADQLEGLASGWGLQAFNGLDGKWHVKHPWGLGELINAGRAPQKYTLASDSIATLGTLMQSFTALSNPLIHPATTKRILKPIQAVEIERGTNRKFITVDLAKDSDFEDGWSSASAHDAWTIRSGTIERSTKSDTGTYAMRINESGSEIEMVVAHFAASSQIHVEIAFRYATEYTPAGSGVTTFSLYAIVDPTDPGQVLDYSAEAGEWAEFIPLNDFPISATPAANGASLTYATYSQVIEAPMPPVDGKLKIRISGDAGANFYTYIDTIELRINDTSGSAVSKFRSVFPRVLDGLDFFRSNIATAGEVAKMARAWFNGVVGLDTDADDTRDEVHELLQSDSDGAGAWIQPIKFESESYQDSGEFDDLAEIVSNSRIEMQEAPLEVIEGEADGILTPASPVQYNNKKYLLPYVKVDLKTEISRYVGVEKLKTFLNPTVADTLYFANSNKQIKKATIDRSLTGWSTSLIRSCSSTTLLDMVIDQAAGYIFTIVAETGDNQRYLRRSDLSGNPSGIIRTWVPADSGFAPTPRMDICTATQQIFVAMTDYTTNDRVEVIDYDGVLVQSASFVRDTTSIGDVAVAEDGSYMVYQTNGGGTKRMQKYDYATNANSDVETIGASVALAAHAFLDDASRYWFGEDAGNDEIMRWPAPSGGSFTNIFSTAGTLESGLAGDRVYKKLYAGTSNSLIKEFAYNGSGERTVIDESLTGYNIKHIHLGV